MSANTRMGSKSGATYYKRGSWNAWCARCGQKFKADQLRLEWDNLRVCPKCFEDRHPQDMVRGVEDRQGVPWAAPEQPDIIAIDSPTQGLTTAAFSAGPEENFDDINTLSVVVTGDPLVSVSELDVLNGANMAAVQNPSGEWEIIQFQTATLTAPMRYTLSHLLRGRVGTENAMMSPLPSGSPFVFIGQSNAATYIWLKNYLGIGNKPFSPCDLRAFYNGDDLVYGWAPRSKMIRLDMEDLDLEITCPLGEVDERYEVDILSPAGTVLRTLHAWGTTQAVYPYADQLTDFGAAPTTYSIRAYQISFEYGRGGYRELTLP